MKFVYRDCLRACSKGILLGLNGFCILLALLMMASFIVNSTLIHQYEGGPAVDAILGYVMITLVAGFLIVIAAFGSIGAARENIKYLSVYACMLAVLMAFQLILTIFISLQRYNLQFQVINWLRDDFFRNVTGEDNISRHQDLWHKLQFDYECCGLNGPEDYITLEKDIDLSCCVAAYTARSDHAKQLLYKACVRNEEYFHSGCEDEIVDAFEISNSYMCSIAVFGYIFETAGILLSMWLSNNLKNEKKIYNETLKY